MKNLPDLPFDNRQMHWKVIGVFPDSNDLTVDNGATDWNSFCYTVGLMPNLEMWVPCQSIEGRFAGPQLTAMVLNRIAYGFYHGRIAWGDEIAVPLGVPGGDDMTSIWWVGRDREPAEKRQVNYGDADWCIPILWSSPLGWPDNEGVLDAAR